MIKALFLFLFIFFTLNISGQILTFDFAGLVGNEVSAGSNFNDAGITTSTITRGAGLTASNNADRFNATNWALTSIANAVAGNNYMEFTITPNAGCDFTLSSIFVQLQRSSTGPSAIALRSSADGFTANLDVEYPIADVTTTQTFTFTFTQTAIAIATTYRIYMYAEAAGGSGGIGDGAGDDLIVNGSTNCTIPNTITTGAITGAPFTVDCNIPATDAGSVDFTSVGTFNVGNIYTAQLSDASGSFASPTDIGTLASTANSGTINFTIPATLPTGSGYLIRVISDNPAIIGSSSAAFTITQSGACGPALPSEGLIINEWSNGPAGNQEFYEFVVAGQCGTVVDIRGYILDDNNGTFTNPADYSGTASGIAPGHFRFSYDAQWASIPVGSLIVVYNADDPNPALPADDPTDSNTDSLYVVPHNNALFERCTTMPDAGSPDSLYTPCAYAVAPLVGWGPLSLRNSGDAIQVRMPNGDYYHGVSYGGSEMSGGPNNLKLFAGSGGGMCGWFSDGDFFDVANWTSGTVAGNETPGIANNAANSAWLIAMRDTAAITCPFVVLPVELILFTGENENDGNLLEWKTASETNSDYFTLERSIDGKNWEIITSPAGAGNTTTLSSYSFIDNRYQPTVNYYRLSQIDFDGARKVYNEFVSIDNTPENNIHLVRIINILGQEINANQSGIQIHIYDDGSSRKFFKDQDN